MSLTLYGNKVRETHQHTCTRVKKACGVNPPEVWHPWMLATGKKAWLILFTVAVLNMRKGLHSPVFLAQTTSHEA